MLHMHFKGIYCITVGYLLKIFLLWSLKTSFFFLIYILCVTLIIFLYFRAGM